MPAGSHHGHIRRSEGARFASREVQPLQVLVANEQGDRLDLIAEALGGLGHEVTTQSLQLTDVPAVTETDRFDLAFVAEGLSADDGLALISAIVRQASCPVIALVASRDPAYIREAARRGVFAYVVDPDPAELQAAIDIAMHRFADYESLDRAFNRRAVIEQAKGILMARHGLDSETAFTMLRDHSQHTGRKLVDVARAVADSHLLLVPTASPAVTERSDP
jgi:AmiR/NasT family two-component response regulator